MENWEYYIKLGGLIFGASGLWKMLELFIRSKMDKKLKAAETKHLQVQSEAQIVDNWKEWAIHCELQMKQFENQVKSLETVAEENKNLMKLSKSQLEKISSLKSRIKSLLEENTELRKEKAALQQQIEQLKKK